MNKDIAREMAVQIVYGTPISGADNTEFLERYFSEEHFSTLLEEHELYTELPEKSMMRYIKKTVTGVFEHLEEIDSRIQQFSRGWSVSRLSGTARAVLRVAVYELLFSTVPAGAAINSAVEIDKGYDDPEVVSFVNGVLGAVARSLSAQTEEKNSTAASAETESVQAEENTATAEEEIRS